MLSILVPVFNFNVVPFVRDLHQQALACNVPFEILCYDDGSTAEYKSLNTQLEELEHLVYVELPENVGRSKIRNLLTEKAKHPYLLFVDCDSQVTSENYVANYLDQKQDDKVLYGGRVYQEHPPEDPQQYLRWFYGVKRETLDIQSRNLHPYRSFLTNNYFIPKKIQEKVRLNEELIGYGHEDTLLGKDLKSQGIPVHHIDNPLCHIGLETAPEFLKKTQQGIANLYYMIQKGYADEDIRLYEFYRLCKKTGTAPLLRTLFRWRKKGFEKNLLSSRPSLRNFDLYKLGILLETAR